LKEREVRVVSRDPPPLPAGDLRQKTSALELTHETVRRLKSHGEIVLDEVDVHEGTVEEEVEKAHAVEAGPLADHARWLSRQLENRSRGRGRLGGRLADAAQEASPPLPMSALSDRREAVVVLDAVCLR